MNTVYKLYLVKGKANFLHHCFTKRIMDIAEMVILKAALGKSVTMAMFEMVMDVTYSAELRKCLIAHWNQVYVTDMIEMVSASFAKVRTQPAITCSRSTVETLEKAVK